MQNSPAMQETQETQFLSLGREDPLEEEMATQPSILAGIIPWTERIFGGLYSPWGLKELTRTEQLSIQGHRKQMQFSCVPEPNSKR